MLTAEGLLHLSELGVLHPDPLDRGLILLGVVHPELPRLDLALLSIGRRDAALLRLHDALFGPLIRAQAACRHCGAQMELELRVDELLATNRQGEPDQTEHRVTLGDHDVWFRLPSSADLQEIRQFPDPEQASIMLIRRCVQGIRKGEADVPYEDLPPDVLSGLERAMDELDRLADIRLEPTCPECGRSSAVIFDIVSFLWIKIAAQTRRLLRELDILARVYSWREADILALSPIRRRTYVEMAESAIAV